MGKSPGQNDHRYDDFMKEVRQKGRDAASGRDSLPALAIDIIRATADGIITLDKDSDGVDDAKRIYEDYIEADSKKAVHQHTPDGKKANISKFRALMGLGSKTTFDPVQLTNDTVFMRQDILKQDAKAKVKSVFPMLVDVARVAVKRDDALSPDELRDLVMKPDPAEKTLEGQLTKAFDILDALRTGEGGLRDDSPEVEAAHSSLGTRIATLKLESDKAEAIAKAQSLGLTVVAA